MSDPKNKSSDEDENSGVSQALEGLDLSDDPFAVKSVPHQVPVSEEEVTVKESMRKRLQKSQEDEVTIVHHAQPRVGFTRAELQEEQRQSVRRKLHVSRQQVLRVILFVGLGAGLTLGGFLLWQHFWSRSAVQRPAIKTNGSHRKKNKPPQLSPLVFLVDKTIASPRALKIGSTVSVRFFVEEWQSLASGNAGILADVRLFDSKGKLVLYQPKVIEFSKKVDKAKKKLQVELLFQIANTTPPGSYQLIIDVNDRNARLHSILQSKIQFVK